MTSQTKYHQDMHLKLFKSFWIIGFAKPILNYAYWPYVVSKLVFIYWPLSAAPARSGVGKPAVVIHLQPSLAQINGAANTLAYEGIREELQHHVAEGSDSASYYAATTNLEPLILPTTIKLCIATDICRLKLGFRCKSHVFTDSIPCDHCLEEEPPYTITSFFAAP